MVGKVENLINRFSGKKTVIIAVTCICVAIYVLINVFHFLRPIPVLFYRNATGAEDIFGLILPTNSAIQEFELERDIEIYSVELQLANFKSVRHNINQVYIYLNDDLVHEDMIDSATVVDNAFHPIAGINANASAGDIMRIVVASRDGVPEEGITLNIRTGFSGNRLIRHNPVYGSYEDLPGEFSMRIYSNERTTLLRNLSERYLDIPVFWIFALFGAIMTLTILSLFIMAKPDEGEPISTKKQGGDR